ncbi:prepilin-type N-terminal cleavage/methylation domain-containing protein [Massilia sp. CCM 9210]|uniref:type II secretion system protein n=1 Tax=Massilia scottii TaxID=3057166 RepID=UPI002796CB5B|nr:prepilin-type N-terminal cleavage/methylation domain-containing protein [Massilia sp. CCM 9210]MDQ1813302.1 prepilin-type N-terminal cleavage/methylation domain-containing protein [Massilia sp. CCM 9210]
MRAKGFTLIEVLVTMAIVAMILTLAVPRYFASVDRAREDVLREDLYLLRDAIDKFYADKNHYPSKLDELVTEKYLRAIPVDPYTKSARSWVPVAPEETSTGMIADVRSGAPNKGRDGTWFKDW